MAYATFDRDARGARAGARSKARPGDHASRLARIETLADVMDSRFRVPGTGIRFGLDALAGLIPGIGDAATAIASTAILYDAWKIGLPRHKLALMGANLLADAAFGAVPLIGDLIDVGWKANRRNARMVREHLEKQARGKRG